MNPTRVLLCACLLLPGCELPDDDASSPVASLTIERLACDVAPPTLNGEAVSVRFVVRACVPNLKGIARAELRTTAGSIMPETVTLESLGGVAGCKATAGSQALPEPNIIGHAALTIPVGQTARVSAVMDSVTAAFTAGPFGKSSFDDKGKWIGTSCDSSD
jgi:hypothetical protein